jgi:hypothetical protein
MPSALHDHELDQSPYSRRRYSWSRTRRWTFTRWQSWYSGNQRAWRGPFHSVRSLASALNIPPTILWWHLHARGYVVRNLYIFPHILTLAQKATPVKSAIELKKMLCLVKHYGWLYSLTGDEPWFHFTINPDHARVLEGAVTPTRSR